jgi:hypothetical protein
MSILTNEYYVIPLKYLFQNIINECNKELLHFEINIKDNNNITKQKINNNNNNQFIINLILAEYIVINNQLFKYNSNKDIISYESKDKSIIIELHDFKIITNHNNLQITQKYIYNCLKKYRKRNYLNKRILKINNEIDRIKIIENKIKNEIINNLNFEKSRKDSHIQNCENKLNDKNKFSKSLFLYNIHKLSNNTIFKLIEHINKKLNIKLEIDINKLLSNNLTTKNKDIEMLFIYFSLCKILKNIELYYNYLNACIENISKNLFALNLKHFIINDILKDRIIEIKNESHYKLQYKFRDYNVYAIDNKNKCKCLGYILALDDKWNIFPIHNDKEEYKLRDINNFIDYIKIIEDEGIYLLEKFI